MTLDTKLVQDHRRFWSTWPLEYQRHWEQWLLEQRPITRESDYPPRSMVSVRDYAVAYTYAQKWATETGRSTAAASLEALWTPATIDALVRDLFQDGYAPTTARTWLIAIERALCAICPEASRDAINRAIKRTPRCGDARKWRDRLQDTQALVDLGKRLMQQAESETDHRSAAILFRIGLMISLLALRPYRRSVLASFDYVPDPAGIARHPGNFLSKEHGAFWLTCRRAGVKRAYKRRDKRAGPAQRRRLSGGKFAPLREDVPAELAPFLETYLGRHRPTLLGANTACDALWVSDHGGRLSSTMIFKDLVAATKREFGRSHCPQLFRTAYAVTVLRKSKTHRSTAHHVLGHLKPMTYQRYLPFDQILTVAVGLENDRILDDLLGDAAFQSRRHGNGDQERSTLPPPASLVPCITVPLSIVQGAD